MAVVAKFVGDFSAFTTAVEKAEAKLVDFAGGAAGVEKALTRMANSFTGKQIIQDALLMEKAIDSVGGVSRLTAKELETVGRKAQEAADKMRALGMDVPPGLDKIAKAAGDAKTKIEDMGTKTTGTAGPFATMAGWLGKINPLLGAFGISLSVGALVQFGRALLDDADQLENLSAKTGIGVEGLQRLQQVGDDTGVSIDSMTRAINAMQVSIASGDKGAAKAFEQLGINMEAFLRLDPDERFIAISDALRKIEDPALQSALAVETMGKAGLEALPALKAGFDDVKNAAVGMSAETVRALDDLGDAFGRWWRTAKGAAAEVVVAVGNTIIPFGEAAKNQREFELSIKNARAEAEKLMPVLKEIRPAGLITDTNILNKALGDEKEQLQKVGERLREAKADAEKFARAQQNIRDQLEGTDWDGTIDSALLLGVSVSDLATYFGKSEGEIKRHQKALETHKKELDAEQKLWDETAKSIDTSRVALDDLTKSLGLNVGQQRQMLVELGKIPLAMKPLADLNKDPIKLPDVKPIIKDFDGLKTSTISVSKAIGAVGDVLGGVQTKFAQMATIAVNAFQSITKSLASGDWLSAVTAGIGAAIGLIGGLFRDAEKEINPLRKSFVEAAGGLDALRDKATEAGVTINALLNAKNAKEYEQAIKDLNQAFEDSATAIEEIGDLQSIIQEAGGVLSAAMKDTLLDLTAIPGLSNDAKDALKALASDTEPDFKALTKMAKDYGIELENLGPQFQQADLTSKAQTIISDFEKLRDAGADVGGVINGMADEINAVVKDSLKFKTEIPENMRPMIQALIDSNQLFDDQGNKITDIGNLKFGSAVETEADKIVKAIKDLGEILKGLPTIANTAAAGITRELSGVRAPDIHQRVVVHREEAGGEVQHQGGVVMHAGGVIDRLASNVLSFKGIRAHSGLAIGEVPIIAQRGEGILSRRDMTALGGVGGFNALRRSLQGGGTQTVNVSTSALESEVRGLRQDLPRTLARAVRDELQKVTTGRR